MRRTLITRKRGIDFCVFQLIALKLGYSNRLNIMKERKSSSGGKTNFHRPRWCSPSASQSKNSVIDAINPAAAGNGKTGEVFRRRITAPALRYPHAALERGRAPRS